MRALKKSEYYSVTHLEGIILFDLSIAEKLRDTVNEAIKSTDENKNEQIAEIEIVDDDAIEFENLPPIKGVQ